MASRKNAVKTTMHNRSVKTNSGTSAPTIHASNAAPNTSRNATVESKPATTQSTTSQAVAEAAYFLWLKRGGDEIKNWLEAEAMIRKG